MEEKASNSKKEWTPKRIALYCGLCLDVVVTIFLLVLSIILLANISRRAELVNANGFMGMIYFFMANPKGPTVFLCAVVIPLFVLLVVNIILTVTYYQKEAAKESKEKKSTSLSDLTDEQKEAIKRELLASMVANEAAKEEPKQELVKEKEEEIVQEEKAEEAKEEVEEKVEEKVVESKKPSNKKATTKEKKTVNVENHKTKKSTKTEIKSKK